MAPLPYECFPEPAPVQHREGKAPPGADLRGWSDKRKRRSAAAKADRLTSLGRRAGARPPAPVQHREGKAPPGADLRGWSDKRKRRSAAAKADRLTSLGRRAGARPPP